MNGLKWINRANKANGTGNYDSSESTGVSIVRVNRLFRRFLLFLCIIFCVAYPIGVTGVAFDVHPSFSLTWAGSALLFLEGSMLIVAMVLSAGWRRGLLASLVVIVLSYAVETIGVNTGFPFGVYYYTRVLFPALPGGVPLAVLFAWVLIIFGVYGWLTDGQAGSQQRGWQDGQDGIQRLGLRGAVIGALLATLLDLEIEPVATHLERYWLWLGPGNVNYYGVPIANFVAWFFVACALLLLVDRIVARRHISYIPFARRRRWEDYLSRTLYVLSLFMFGLVDLTHGYYGAALMGVLAGLALVINTF